MKNKFIWFVIFAIVFAVLIIWIAWGNTALELNSYVVASSRLPESFEGYRIVHVSDLHYAQLGKENEKLLMMIRESEPDMMINYFNN